jgi:HEAT repeat protein
MNCDGATKNFSLFLYVELSIEEEQAFQDHLESCEACRKAFEAEMTIHELLDSRDQPPSPALLARCRRDLNLRVQSSPPAPSSWRAWFRNPFPALRMSPAFARPAGALALVALGFFAARWTTPRPMTEPESEPVSVSQPAPRVVAAFVDDDSAIARVRYVQPQPSGQVRVVVEETRQRFLTGDPGDEQIHRLLLTAARDSADPGLRAESMDILRTRPASSGVRSALIYALQHDSNPGVRLKAIDALKAYAGEADVRNTLAKVLLADDNPGVRTQAIDLLIQHKEDAIVGVLQEAVQRESNSYIRQRCQRALQEMNASVGTF